LAARRYEPGTSRAANSNDHCAIPETLRTETVTTDVAVQTVQGCLARLTQGYQAGEPQRPHADRHLGTLAIARGALHALARDERLVQVAVIGPTQVGKSTIVNMLLGAELATAGPLAGLTTRPQRFEWKTELGEASVWDTPDFDSLASGAYRDRALEVLGEADVLVLVVSPEKYADLSVWDLLRNIEPLRRPMVVCLNKVTAHDGGKVRESLRHHLDEVFGEFCDSDLVGVTRRDSPDERSKASRTATGVLRDRVIAALRDAGDRRRLQTGAYEFLQTRWHDWMRPVVAEHAAAKQWNERVEAVLTDAESSYEREFLAHPRRYDTFRRATAELLTLLEVPRVGGAIGIVRTAVTYPARRLLEAVGSSWRSGGTTDTTRVHGEGSEQTVLFNLVERTLSRLGRDAARKEADAGSSPVWKVIGQRLAEREEELRNEFREAARTSCKAFEPEIEAAADRLFRRLRRQPAVLNALRTMRASTDLAGVALAVHSGGAPLDDLLFAPAMFAVTSMLTEGALGSYMASVAADLKSKRKSAVVEGLFEGVFAEGLKALAGNLNDEGLFAIDSETLQEAQRALELLGGKETK